jgi:hypothetical protein
MDYLHGPTRQRRFRRPELESILGRETLTVSLASAGFSLCLPADSFLLNPKHHIAQFAGSGNRRIG